MVMILDIVTIVAPYVAVFSAFAILWAVRIRDELFECIEEKV